MFYEAGIILLVAALFGTVAMATVSLVVRAIMGSGIKVPFERMIFIGVSISVLVTGFFVLTV